MANTSKSQSKQKITGLANYFIKLKIGEVDISPDAINLITIRNWIFDIVPRLELTITDDGSLYEIWPIKDNTEISIELGKNEKSDHIFCDFIVDNYSVDPLTGNGSYIFSITAFLKYSDLFHPIHTRSFKKKTSVDVLEQIAQENNWSADKKISNSSDKQTWLQINQNNYDMIKHVLKRSSVNNDLLIPFLSLSSKKEDKTKFTITSLNTEYNNDKIKICRFDLNNANAEEITDEADKKIIWFLGHKYQNHSGYLNKVLGGYGLTSSYYDLKKKQTLSSKIDSHEYSENSDQSHIGSFIDSINYGTLTDNTHANFYKGQITNRNLIGLSFNNLMTIRVNALSIVDLMDTISFVSPSINQKQVDNIHSDLYIVVGMCYYATKGSPLNLEISVSRNGYNNTQVV